MLDRRIKVLHIVGGNPSVGVISGLVERSYDIGSVNRNGFEKPNDWLQKKTANQAQAGLEMNDTPLLIGRALMFGLWTLTGNFIIDDP